jgi:hypothetical protein
MRERERMRGSYRRSGGWREKKGKGRKGKGAAENQTSHKTSTTTYKEAQNRIGRPQEKLCLVRGCAKKVLKIMKSKFCHAPFFERRNGHGCVKSASSLFFNHKTKNNKEKSKQGKTLAGT